MEKNIVSQCVDRRTKIEKRRELEVQTLSSRDPASSRKRPQRSLIDDAIEAAEVRDLIRKRQAMSTPSASTAMENPHTEPTLITEPTTDQRGQPETETPISLENTGPFWEDSYAASTSIPTDFLSLEALEQMGWTEGENQQ